MTLIDRDYLYENLVEWIRSFSFVNSDTDITALLDGEIIAEILYNIEPTYFNDEWKSKFTFDSSSNWRLKASNLKKIMNTMSEFLRNNLNFTLENFQFPDVNMICESCDIGEMSRLIQLVLLCAVNCSRKEINIQNIMALENTVQMVIMKAIQELMDNESPMEGSVLEDKLSASGHQLQVVQQEKEELRQKCHESELKISLLEEEKASLDAELRKYRKNESQNKTDSSISNNLIVSATSSSANNTGTPESVRIRQLQEKVANMQSEIYNLEHAKEDLSQKIMECESENSELKQNVDNLTEKLIDQRHMKDELDIARERLKTMTNMESTLEKYKKHIDNSGDVVRQNRELEIENSKYLERVIKLEEDVRVVASLKSQIEMYKTEIIEIQSQCSKKEKDLSKSEFDLKRSVEKMKSLELDKRNLQEELQKIREENEDMHVTSYTVGSESSSEPNSESHDLSNPHHHMSSSLYSSTHSTVIEDTSLDLMQIPYQMREKVIRLQKEVRQLRQIVGRGDDNGDGSGALGDNGDNSLNIQSEFQGKSREQLIVSLEAAQARIHQLSTENKQLHQDHLVLNAKIEDGDPTRFQGINVENQKVVTKLKHEMESMENKYKGYLEKAKYVIYQLHQKLLQLEQEKLQGSQELAESPPTPTGENDASNQIGTENKEVITRADYETMKRAFYEKERQLDQLQKQFDRAHTVREEEEKMLVAAWYNLGVRVHREGAQERLRAAHHPHMSGGSSRSTLDSGGGSNSTIAGAGEPSSFLARQRTAHLNTVVGNNTGASVSQSSIGD